MRLANLGHATCLVEADRDRYLIDPLAAGSRPEPLESVDLDPIAAEATAIVLSCADPLHAHGPTLRRLLPGKRLVAPAAVIDAIGEAAGVAAEVTALAPFEPAKIGAIELVALPGRGVSRSSLLLRHGGELLWALGPQEVDRNRVLDIARHGLGPGGGSRLAAIASADLDHVSRVGCGGARGFPARAVAARVRTLSALASSGFRVALVGGVVFSAGGLDHLARPLGRARLAAELGDAVVAPEVGRWHALDLGERGDRVGPVRRSDGGDGAADFDPSLGLPELAGDGAPIAGLERLIADRFRQLESDEMTLGYHASLLEWGVRVEIREHATDGVRRIVATPADGGPRLAVDPPRTGTITIAADARSLAALIAGEATAIELAAAGLLRCSERVISVRRGVRRPSWIGPQRPGPTERYSALGHLPTPLAIAGYLGPAATLPEWPDRWPGERETARRIAG